MIYLHCLLFLTAVFCGTTAISPPGCAPNPPHLIVGMFNGRGDLYSPGYENNTYPNDLQCLYSIRAPFGTRILLSFEDFDIDPFDLCMKDALIIHEGPDTSGPAHGIFCGSEKPNDLMSYGNALTLFFRSDFLTGRKGFHIKYSIVFGQTLCPGQKLCRNRKCYSFLNSCNGQDDCGDGTDEENCNHPLPVSECGTTPIQPLNAQGLDRVIGGQESKVGSIPWQADLQLAMFSPNGHSCGGTLINAEWVLTAGHCFQRNARTHEWRIHLGNHNKYKTDEHEQIRYVKRIIIYPDRTGELELISGGLDMQNDIALIKLNAPIKFSDHVRPACLPSQNQELNVGDTCLATGWGMTRGTGSNDVLKQVPLSVQQAAKCTNDMVPFTPKSMICVKNTQGFNDVCHGDSGGPFACKLGGRYYVMGATSFGTVTNFMSGACALPGAHTVYTKVADKADWITRMIQTYND